MKRLAYFLCLVWLFFAAFSTATYADSSLNLTTMLWSHHVDRSKDYNESHRGIGLSYVKDKHIFSTMTYENSKYRRTVTATYGRTLWKGGAVSVAAHAGLATGYEVPVGAFLTVKYKNLVIYNVPTVVTAIGFTWEID